MFKVKVETVNWDIQPGYQSF